MQPACQKCGRHQATNHVTVIGGGTFTEIHFCEECSSKSSSITEVPNIPRCDRCGLALHDIQERGRLGCAKDYEVFSKDLEACIQNYHGTCQHVGKTPKRFAWASSKDRR